MIQRLCIFRTMESIYSYIDYREWLNDLFAEKKRDTPHFSYRLFGSKVNLDPSFLAKVLSGKRDLSTKSVESIAGYFSLTEGEASYFQTLLTFAKAKKESDKQIIFDELMVLRRTESRVIVADQYEFYTKWYYSALRNLLQIYRFDGEDFRKLGKQLSPAISALQARTAIELLEKLSLIEIGEEGFYQLTQLAVSTGTKWDSLAIRKYHQNNIDLGREAIDRFPKDIRDISGVTMNIGKDDLPKIREMITKFRQDLIQYVNRDATPEQVYHLNLQFFPFSNESEQ